MLNMALGDMEDHEDEEEQHHDEVLNEEYDVTAAYNQNHAFVFIKPHANTPATQALVSSQLVAQGIEIHDEGELTAAHIEDNKLIDKQ